MESMNKKVLLNRENKGQEIHINGFSHGYPLGSQWSPIAPLPHILSMGGGEYELQKKIGAGRFGRVYRAFVRSTGKLVAVKMVESGGATETSQMLSHKNVVQLLASFPVNTNYYAIVMELCKRSVSNSSQSHFTVLGHNSNLISFQLSI